MNQTISLPASWVERIFGRLLGIYGRQFSDKYSRIVGNVDVGFENAKAVWAEELAGFHDMPEAISHALKNLDPKFPPSALEFRELCRHAPKKEVPALPYKPTPEDRERAEKAISRASAIVKGKGGDGIDTEWATKPRSAMHLQFIFDAAKRDQRFLPCIAQMVEKGICTEDGKLLKRYAGGGSWTNP